MPRIESPVVLSEFAVRSHKEKACFPFRVSLESVGPLSGASTQTAVMEQMPLNGSPVRTSGLRQSRLSFSCSFPRALQPHDLFPVICRWQTSGRLREAAGGPKRRSTISFSLCDRLNSGIHLHIFQQRGFWVFVARLYRLNPCIAPALCGSARQPAANLIWQSKVSPSCANSSRHGCSVTASAAVEELAVGIVFSGGHKLFPQFNQAWNPFGQTQDWFPFESFSDKKKNGGGIAVRAGTTSRRQNTWQKWNFIAFSCRSRLTEWGTEWIGRALIAPQQALNWHSWRFTHLNDSTNDADPNCSDFSVLSKTLQKFLRGL